MAQNIQKHSKRERSEHSGETLQQSEAGAQQGKLQILKLHG